MKNPFIVLVWFILFLLVFAVSLLVGTTIDHRREEREVRMITCVTRSQIYAVFRNECLGAGNAWQEGADSPDCPGVRVGTCQTN